MPIKQKITSSLFMALLLMPVLLCGYFLWQQHSIKEEMEERLEKQQIITLSILKKDVQWIEVGKELIINGEMFDVKSIEEEGEMLNIKGLYDVAEKKIKQKIASLLQKKNTPDNPLQKLIAKFAMPFICSAYHSLQLSQTPITTIKKKTILYKERIYFLEIKPSTPPPNYYS